MANETRLNNGSVRWMSRTPVDTIEGQPIEALVKEYEALQKEDHVIIYLQENKAKLKDDLFPNGSNIGLCNRITGCTASLIIASGIITGVACLILLLSNQLPTFPQNFLALFHKVNYIGLGVGLGIPVALIGGALFVIYRAITKKESLLAEREIAVTYDLNGVEQITIISRMADIPKEGKLKRLEVGEILSESNRGAFCFIDQHLETILLRNPVNGKTEGFTHFYIDLSTLKNGTGKALVYNIKHPFDHYMISTIVPFFGTPIYLIGACVYNIVRAAVIPFYILVQCMREWYSNKAIYPKERFFKPSDIPKEFLKSIRRAVKAPFYALAYIMAGIYSLVNPMGGRKLASAIERDWNEGVSLAEGYWSVQGGSKYWQFEGGGGPKGLGRNAFYLAGCWQPVAVAEYEDGNILNAYRIEGIVHPTTWEEPFKIITKEGSPAFQQLKKDPNVKRFIYLEGVLSK
jgi:hypothetical protein